MGRKAPKFSSLSADQQPDAESGNATQNKKQLHIRKQEPTSKVILEKIATEFKANDDCGFEFRASEIDQLQNHIEANLTNNCDGFIDVVAEDVQEGAVLTDKVLNEHFGRNLDYFGGDDPRVFVLTYNNGR